MELKYKIINSDHYPNNGKHQTVLIDLPFDIKKGEDIYFWVDKKDIEQQYGHRSGKVDNRWIVHLKKSANISLKEIFEVKLNKDLDKILKYCKDLYIKSLTLEIKRLNEELNTYL